MTQADSRACYRRCSPLATPNFSIKISTFLAALLAQDTGGSSNITLPSDAPQKYYSSGFVGPVPPRIQSEFRANYMQHKFDVNVSNIVSGYIYVSPGQQKVRADGASDGMLEVSIFDFKNTSAASNGSEVSNIILSYVGPATQPQCSSFFVAPFIHAVPEDFLIQSNAVYSGVRHDELYGPVNAWSLLAEGLIVTIFLDEKGTFVRYDFAAPNTLRTFTTTRFFNIIPGPIDSSVFETSCTLG
ncbi:unnamed protein product [Cyclocybe aegerita]|uniref:Uncharacterized protein n=1 Tax=Cyclocybe aegerita TaxID=1973307 RepID=A0A8S0VYB9_CYCAE|nr:unnamed protein product [Cyclocybe aegerita]